MHGAPLPPSLFCRDWKALGAGLLGMVAEGAGLAAGLSPTDVGLGWGWGWDRKGS